MIDDSLIRAATNWWNSEKCCPLCGKASVKEQNEQYVYCSSHLNQLRRFNNDFPGGLEEFLRARLRPDSPMANAWVGTILSDKDPDEDNRRFTKDELTICWVCGEEPVPGRIFCATHLHQFKHGKIPLTQATANQKVSDWALHHPDAKLHPLHYQYVCSRCEEELPLEGDYLCKKCRFGS